MWKTVAEGTSLEDLASNVGEMELSKGTKVRAVLDMPGWHALMDVAGAELVVAQFLPPGMDILDVWGEDGKGYIEMEADPAWLLAILAFMKAHWLAIIISGFVLMALVSFIRVMVWTVAAPQNAFAIVVVAGGALILIQILRRRARQT